MDKHKWQKLNDAPGINECPPTTRPRPKQDVDMKRLIFKACGELPDPEDCQDDLVVGVLGEFMYGDLSYNKAMDILNDLLGADTLRKRLKWLFLNL